jgi:hypothetical protein
LSSETDTKVFERRTDIRRLDLGANGGVVMVCWVKNPKTQKNKITSDPHCVPVVDAVEVLNSEVPLMRFQRHGMSRVGHEASVTRGTAKAGPLRANTTNLKRQPWKHFPTYKSDRARGKPTRCGCLSSFTMKLRDDLAGLARKGRCSSCQSSVTISKSQTSSIDECGFENYKILRQDCGASLVAIIDPRDCRPLISEIK